MKRAHKKLSDIKSVYVFDKLFISPRPDSFLCTFETQVLERKVSTGKNLLSPQQVLLNKLYVLLLLESFRYVLIYTLSRTEEKETITIIRFDNVQSYTCAWSVYRSNCLENKGYREKSCGGTDVRNKRRKVFCETETVNLATRRDFRTATSFLSSSVGRRSSPYRPTHTIMQAGGL